MSKIPLDPKQAGERLGKTEQTLAHWRSKGLGPRYCKLGNRVVYFEADLDEFIESRMVEPQGERGAA